ncbi:c-type cytochrome [Luteimonas sp. R10]|uniref:c-type cytochrome n=1 Tax=Luteimonas sp. R10 TaxID=3108176 RepID=UPI0030851CB9|nr:c-type cytochrome [Luteimonas sp. R10]
MGSVFFRFHSHVWIVLLAASLAQLRCAANAADADLLAEGHTLYENKCGGCHSVETNRIGPRHQGVIGRRVAGVPDYDYSPALKQLDGTWTPARLDLWLSDTQRMAPRSKMYLVLDDANQRRLIIAYLQSVSGTESSS